MSNDMKRVIETAHGNNASSGGNWNFEHGYVAVVNLIIRL